MAEKLIEYRHVIEKETKEIFIGCLKQAIKSLKPKKIGFIGVIDSEKPRHHDIDLLIFPGESSKVGETIIELNKLYDVTEKILKKNHERLYLAVSPKKELQELIYYVSALEEGGAGMIPIHSLFFPCHKSFKKFNPKDFQKDIKNKTTPLFGNFEVIYKTKELSPKQYEPYFYLRDFEMNAKIKTFPRHLIRSSAESLFEYLREKYHLPIKKKKFHTVAEIESEFKRLLKLLDQINYE